MYVVANGLISVAAAALFFLVEPHLLGLGQPWSSIAAVAVLAAAALIAHRVNPAAPTPKAAEPEAKPEPEPSSSLLSDNEAGKDLEIITTDADLTRHHGKTLSGNKSKGNTKIDLSGSKI